jgi:hypothetical protein
MDAKRFPVRQAGHGRPVQTDIDALDLDLRTYYQLASLGLHPDAAKIADRVYHRLERMHEAEKDEVIIALLSQRQGVSLRLPAPSEAATR